MKNPVLFAIALLGACATEPDVPPTPTATVTGIVEIDRAIEGATVYVDFNDNNLLDSNEPQVATDANGRFTVTWEYPEQWDAHTIGAIAEASGFSVHLRAPFADDVVISPLTTLVVAEMASDAALTQEAAAAKIASALTASQMPFSQPLDVMADYADPSAPNSLALRRVSAAVAAIISTSVDNINAAQSWVDSNDATYFNPAIVAIDAQLTAIATGTHKFTQLSTEQQHDVHDNPLDYRGFFIDTNALADAIEDELVAFGLQLLADLFDTIREEFIASFEQIVIEMLAEELIEILV
jgi:hypothetical protein